MTQCPCLCPCHRLWYQWTLCLPLSTMFCTKIYFVHCPQLACTNTLTLWTLVTYAQDLAAAYQSCLWWWVNCHNNTYFNGHKTISCNGHGCIWGQGGNVWWVTLRTMTQCILILDAGRIKVMDATKQTMQYNAIQGNTVQYNELGVNWAVQSVRIAQYNF